MEIYLMQHGQAFSGEADPERSLTPQGENQIGMSARALGRMSVGFDLILSSPKKRALQTAEIVARQLKVPEEEIKVTDTLQPNSPALEAINYIKAYEDKARVLLTGHLPSLGEIASHLLSQESRVAIDFNMGGVCRIDVHPLQPGSGELKWVLAPEQLKLMVEKQEEKQSR
jgi:phosphohistidine phosphatase